MLQLIFMRLFQDFNKKGRFVCNLFEPTCREKGFSLSPIRSQDKSHTKQPLLPHKTAVLTTAEIIAPTQTAFCSTSFTSHSSDFISRTALGILIYNFLNPRPTAVAVAVAVAAAAWVHPPLVVDNRWEPRRLWRSPSGTTPPTRPPRRPTSSRRRRRLRRRTKGTVAHCASSVME